jgi:nicotinamide-nucleotide amidase
MQTISDEQLYQSTQQLALTLQECGLTLCSAESCTGGWLAKCCTDLAGSSAWFERGVVTYSNQSKQDLLGVKAETLEQFGAVSEQIASEMAIGALVRAAATISVAITGIAGPDGGSENKPVGTVCFAWKREHITVVTASHHFDGDRESVRRQAVVTAIQGIIKNARD